jgi:hypothetical protein
VKLGRIAAEHRRRHHYFDDVIYRRVDSYKSSKRAIGADDSIDDGIVIGTRRTDIVPS